MSKTTLSIPASTIEFQQIGDTKPHARLLGSLEIAGVSFHVEAIQVNSRGHATSPEGKSRLDLVTALDDEIDFQTVKIDRRNYVLFMTPPSA